MSHMSHLFNKVFSKPQTEKEEKSHHVKSKIEKKEEKAMSYPEGKHYDIIPGGSVSGE